MKNVDIIMLSLTTNKHLHDMTLRAIDSLRASENDIKFNVILIESNKSWSPKEYPYHNADALVIPDAEFNYNKYCNIGLQSCKSEWIALCNNDLIFHKGWFSNILEANKQRPDIKSFCPWNSYDMWHERAFGNPQVDIIEGYRTSYEVGGWCLVAKKEVYDTINLDDRVSFWYSDNIYADELIKHGFKHALVKNSKVDHICSQTSAIFDRNTQMEMTYGQQEGYIKGK